MNAEPGTNRPQDRDRASEFRQALVATANLGPYVRRRPPLKLVVGAIAAFAIAGALTGGAVANATTGNSAVAADEAAVAGGGQQYAAEEDGILIGTPYVRSGSSTVVIDVGHRPSGANTIVEAFQCTDPGTFSELLDSRQNSQSICTRDDAPNVFQGSQPIADSRDHVFTFTPVGSARFSVWLSWAKIPKLVDSIAQKKELADGLVTRQEDLDAYNRYAGCMNALGHPLGDVPTTTIVPNYTVNSAAVDDGTDNRCYQTEYNDVDGKWQIENEETNIGDTSIEACLRVQGIDPAATPKERWSQLQGAGLGLTQCTYVG